MLIWQANTKRSNNKISLNPAGMSNPIAVTYIPVCENRVQIESVCSVDSSSIVKRKNWLGVVEHVLVNFVYWDQGYGG